MSLKLSLRNHYPKVIDRNGRKVKTTMFVFNVSGSPKELEQYETAQGENLRIDEETKKMLFFTSQWPGASTCELRSYFTKEGETRFQADTLAKELKIQDIMIVEEAKARVKEDLYGMNQSAIAPAEVAKPRQMEVPTTDNGTGVAPNTDGGAAVVDQNAAAGVENLETI